VTEPDASQRAFHEILVEIVGRSEGVPDHEVIGFIKGMILAHRDLSDPDRAAAFDLATRVGKAVRPLDRGDVHVNVNTTQNANSSATASPQVSNTVNVSENRGTEAGSGPAAPTGSNAAEAAPLEDRDGMTTLLRRDAFDAQIPTLLATAKDDGKPLSLIMVDVDHFKKVNDTYGHPKGDEVLKDVGRCVAMMIGEKGVPYRYGGEEIAVVLPSHDAQQAATLAERLRAVLQAQRPGDLDITASMGVACFPDHAATLAELVKKADDALYASKDGGRNQVRVHGVDGSFKPASIS
jgi:diguanylate cyclase (GGDEF)-like protein